MKPRAPKLDAPGVAPAAEVVVDGARPLDDAKGTWKALLATGMDRFEAIDHAGQVDHAVVAQLWLEALRLVAIPAGTFGMGSPEGEADRTINEGPTRDVTIEQPFRMSAFQTTQGAWNALMGVNPSRWQDDPDQPVGNVSWDDICGQDGFLERLNLLTEGVRPVGTVFRLPSEAEWEYACRAGTTTPWSFGDNPALFPVHGWFDVNSEGRTHPVGRKAPNPWGLFDMHGNAGEWCADVWHTDYLGALNNEGPWMDGGDPTRVVVRGGDWLNDSTLARSAYRSGSAKFGHSAGLGFRVVMGTPQAGAV
jgi:formylglycine-generating enzyme required for sulfatase activity